MEIEPFLNTPEMKKVQFEKLKKILVRLKANAPYYARMMQKNSLDPEKLKEPANDYFKELMNKISFERGENHPMLDLTDQLNAELLNRLSPPTDDTV